MNLSTKQILDVLQKTMHECDGCRMDELEDCNTFTCTFEVNLKTAMREKKPVRKMISVYAEQRIADRIDGYDRDDLGESPDF